MKKYSLKYKDLKLLYPKPKQEDEFKVFVNNNFKDTADLLQRLQLETENSLASATIQSSGNTIIITKIADGEWNLEVNTDVISGGSSSISGDYATVTLVENVSASLQSQIDSISGSGSDSTLVGGEGISVVESPTDTWTISVSGDYVTTTEVENISGNLQTQIDSNDSDISDLQVQIGGLDIYGDKYISVEKSATILPGSPIQYNWNVDFEVDSISGAYVPRSEVENVTGNLQSQINNIEEESTELLGGEGISVTESPTNTWTISVSGDYITTTEVENISGNLQTQIDSNDSDISNLTSSISELTSGSAEYLQKADGSGGLTDSFLSESGNEIILDSGTSLKNAGGTPDIGDADYPFGMVYAKGIFPLRMYRWTSNNFGPHIAFYSNNDAGAYHTYADIHSYVEDDTDGAEDGSLWLQASDNGAVQAIVGVDKGGLVLQSGKTLTNDGGTPNIGSALKPFGTGYFTNIVSISSDYVTTTEVENISGNLQSQITSNDSDISDLQNYDTLVAGVTADHEGRIITLESNPVPDIFRSEVENVSGNLQTQINNIEEESTELLGGEGISVTESPTNIWTISVSGDYVAITEVENVSGNLQSQITSNDSDISDLQNYDTLVAGVTADHEGRIITLESNPVPDIFRSEVENVSGNLQSQIDSNDSDISDLQNYDTLVAGVTADHESRIDVIESDYLTSTDLDGYATETLIENVSGNLQTQINNIEEESTELLGGEGISVTESPTNTWTISVSGDYITTTEVENISGNLQSQIDSNDSDISNLTSSISELTSGSAEYLQKADGSGGLTDSFLSEDGNEIILDSGTSLKNAGGTPDIGDADYPFGTVYAKGIFPLRMYRWTSNNYGPHIEFYSNNEAGAYHAYADIISYVEDDTDGAEDGSLWLQASNNGTVQIIAGVDKDGLVLESGKTLTNTGGTPDIGTYANPFGTINSNSLRLQTSLYLDNGSEIYGRNAADTSWLNIFDLNASDYLLLGYGAVRTYIYADTTSIAWTDGTKWQFENSIPVYPGTGEPAFGTATQTWGTGFFNDLRVDKAAGNGRWIRFLSDNSSRWILGASDAAESGSDAGSDLTVLCYDDSGTYIDNPFAINRASGGTIWLNRPVRAQDTSIGSSAIQLNTAGSGNRYAFIDLVGDDTYTDYGLRIIRNNTGPNANSIIYHRGTGNLLISTDEAANIVFQTDSTNRLKILASGGLELASGNDLTNAGGTPDIGDASNPFGSIHPQAIEFDPVAANPGDSETLWANSTDSNKLYYGSSEVGGSGGEWNTTTTQETSSASYTFTSADIGKLKAFTNSGDIDGTLPALDSTYDNKIIMVGNLDKTNTKTVTIDCDLDDRIGQSGYGWGIDLPDPGATVVTLLGDLDNHRWHIINAVGGRVLDEGCKLYERCNEWTKVEEGSNNAIHIDDTQQHVALASGDVDIAGGEDIGVGCWNFPGSNENVTYVDSTDWDIANTGVFTILVRFNIDSSKTHELMAHYEDANNRWRLYVDGSDNVNFKVVSGGTTQVDLTSTTTLSTGTWYTVVIHKTGTVYGLYIDGNQEDYDTWASTDTFTGDLYVGQNGADANYLNGKINQIGIWHQDRFDATPNAGSTDTIVVPDNHLTVNYGT